MNISEIIATAAFVVICLIGCRYDQNEKKLKEYAEELDRRLTGLEVHNPVQKHWNSKQKKALKL